MSAAGKEYTLHFAWVPPSTPWDVSLARFDENVFDLVIEHDEGQLPTAVVEIKNPHIGFINPSRLYWAWISFSFEACPPQPLFRGRLVGIPEELADQTVKMKFIARNLDYVFQKQQVARSLKVLPNYDPIFFEVAKRDDPDAILEGWSALYHVGRAGRVSASDVLVGEEGTINFAPQDVFYDSVKCRLLQSPLVAVNVKAEVAWEQRYRDAFYVGQWAYPTLGNDPFVQDWPKSGTNLGGGWFTGISWAGQRDPFGVATEMGLKPGQYSFSYSWSDKTQNHLIGDVIGFSLSYTTGFGNQLLVRFTGQPGLIDPFHIDDVTGEPAPINIPARGSWDWFCYKGFALDFAGRQSMATLGLIYDANRKRSDRLEMTVTAAVQPILIDPLVTEDTEQITLKSGDLGLPLIDLANWDTFAYGQAVSLGQFIYPDNPLVPGQTSSQICVQAGNTGMVEPVFSNNAGATTVDGTVIWASLGATPPTEQAQDWVRLAPVSLGTLLIPKPISGAPNMASLIAPGQINYPPTGTSVPVYTIYCFSNGGPGDTMFECTVAGLIGGFVTGNVPPPPGGPVTYPPPGVPPGLPTRPLPPPVGGIPLAPPATFNVFLNPTGAFLYICVRAGKTGEFHTTFNETSSAQTTDGTVIWQNIGPVQLPIGGWPGMTPSPCYFPTDRGQQSVQHMFCRARAKLRKRARAVEVSFDTRFEVAAQLSCRMNGKVTDPRLPGGTVSGKVISYKIEAHGDSGELKGSVVLGCSVGHEALTAGALASRATPSPSSSLTDPGVPSYVQEGYVQRGYQQYYSSQSGGAAAAPPVQGVTFPRFGNPPNWPLLPPTLPPETCPPLDSVWSAGPVDLAGDEMSYTPPVYEPNDDGLVFPAAPGDLILRQQWHGIASTLNPGNIAIYNAELYQVVHDAVAQASSSTDFSVETPDSSISLSQSIPVSPMVDIDVAVQTAVLQSMMQGTGLWYELVLRPLTNGPFANYYLVQSSPLLVPQTIDLSAPSTGGLLRYTPRS